jgi:hypothetical protein
LQEASVAARSSDDLDDPLGNAERVPDTLRVKLPLFSSSIPFFHTPECHHNPSGEILKNFLLTFMNTLQFVYKKRTAKKRTIRP